MRARVLVGNALALVACSNILGIGGEYRLEDAGGSGANAPDTGGTHGANGGHVNGGAAGSAARAEAGRDATGATSEQAEGGAAGDQSGSPSDTGGSNTAGGTGGRGGTGTGGSGGDAANGGDGARAGTGGTAGHSTGGSAGKGDTTGGVGGSTGGSTATGGAGVGTGGTSAGTGATAGGAGSSSISCDATWMVTMDGFVRMPATGGACWSGYAFGGGDTSSTVMFPGGGTDFSKSAGKLELSGTVGSATADNMYAGYVYFGFNIGQTAGTTSSGKVTPTGTGLTITCTGCAVPMMRAQLTDGTTTWCANLTSGTAIAYTAFTQQCYDLPPGAAYAKAPINSIMISIPGAATAATFDLTVMTVVEN